MQKTARLSFKDIKEDLSENISYLPITRHKNNIILFKLIYKSNYNQNPTEFFM